MKMDLGVDVLLGFSKDTTDRNHASPLQLHRQQF